MAGFTGEGFVELPFEGVSVAAGFAGFCPANFETLSSTVPAGAPPFFEELSFCTTLPPILSHGNQANVGFLLFQPQRAMSIATSRHAASSAVIAIGQKRDRRCDRR